MECFKYLDLYVSKGGSAGTMVSLRVKVNGGGGTAGQNHGYGSEKLFVSMMGLLF